MSDPQLLTALTTEHFTLQGARAQTMSESSARASLYIVAVSSTLVALGAIFDASLGVAAAGGGLVAILSAAGWIEYSDRLFTARADEVEPLFPSG